MHFTVNQLGRQGLGCQGLGDNDPTFPSYNIPRILQFPATTFPESYNSYIEKFLYAQFVVTPFLSVKTFRTH